MKRIWNSPPARFVREIVELYFSARVSRSAAELAYFLILTFFPILICVNAYPMPFAAYVNATYFTLRSGGQTLVTFLFDSCFVWLVCVPLAFCLSRFTPISIVPLFAICQGTDLVKCGLGAFMLKKGKWIQNLTQ